MLVRLVACGAVFSVIESAHISGGSNVKNCQITTCTLDDIIAQTKTKHDHDTKDNSGFGLTFLKLEIIRKQFVNKG